MNRRVSPSWDGNSGTELEEEDVTGFVKARENVPKLPVLLESPK